MSSAPNSILQTEIGTVVRVDRTRPGAQELTVSIGGSEARAINYTELLGEVAPQEQVLLNVTAVRASLGTGGYHFVMKRTGEERPVTEGHIVKLRYTPLQFRCRTVEEEGGPYREAVEATQDLGDMSVIVAPLHSHLPAAAAGVKALAPEARVVYVMTDTAALPFAFSTLAAQLKEAGLLEASITVGQAFGGDYEAVTLYSGLLAARGVLGADVVIVAQGPGNVGTGTEWGFGSITQGEQINAVTVLGGVPIAVPRISFADARPRHQGVSRQTLVALGRVALTQTVVSIPDMPQERLDLVQRQLEEEGIFDKHEVLVARGEPGLALLRQHGIEVMTMGRSMDEDPEFFLAAAAAGAIAAARFGAPEAEEEEAEDE